VDGRGPNWIHGAHENPLVPLLPLTTPPSVAFDPYESGAGVLHIPAPGGPKLRVKDAADGIFMQVMLAIARAEEYSRRFGRTVDRRWSLGDYLGVAAEVKYGVSVPRGLGPEHGDGDGEWEKERVRVREFETRFMMEGGNGGVVGVVGKIIGGSGDGEGGSGSGGGAGAEDGNRGIDTPVSPEGKAKVFMQMGELWGAWVGEPLGKQGLRWFIMEEGMEGGK